MVAFKFSRVCSGIQKLAFCVDDGKKYAIMSLNSNCYSSVRRFFTV